LSEETFQAAEWIGQNAAGIALAQMASRFSRGEGDLARLVREQQDIRDQWQQIDKQLVATLALPPPQRNAENETQLRQRLAEADRRLLALNARLAKTFPEYATLASPEPLSFEATRELLRADEACVRFGFGGPDAFAWVVTREGARWIRLGDTTANIRSMVQTLRCGLDRSAWESDVSPTCAELSKTASNTTGDVPRFDLETAHELYQALFGQIEDTIKDKHLIIVPSRFLSSLPFQVLVTEKPSLSDGSNNSYSDAAWLIKRHRIAMLPSISSLKALRRYARTSKAAEPYIGFGNPLLSGPDNNDRSAWAKQSCKDTPSVLHVADRTARRAIPKLSGAKRTDVELLRNQYPLPDTADELCAVARLSGAADSAVHLGEKATEKIIKELSAAKVLEKARVLHFATHGLMASESEMLAATAEPALLLTPPSAPTEEDDGLLTASEVAQLKLNADWVILSACNTAAGGADGAETLSGLARAFFYAGARAVLVSHWAVDSDATVKLITKTFDEIKLDANTGRAEALRRSMITLISEREGYSHPSYWAPFVIVGEGSR
jgi:CHAT domain-containing protein